MSLINDALKRAKAAQQDAPPESGAGPHLRPVDTDVIVRRGAGVLLPIALAIVAMLILFFVWRYAPRGTGAAPAPAANGVREVRARTQSTETPRSPTGTDTSAGSTAAQPAVKSASSSLPDVQTPAAGAQLAPVGSTGSVANVISEAHAGSQVSAPVAVAAPAGVPAGTNEGLNAEAKPVTPTLPRLQGIVFNPNRPSVVINGKTLFLGDRVAGFRVLAIARDSATLVGGGQTNVLALEE